MITKTVFLTSVHLRIEIACGCKVWMFNAMNHSKVFYQKKTNWNWTYFRMFFFKLANFDFNLIILSNLFNFSILITTSPEFARIPWPSTFWPLDMIEAVQGKASIVVFLKSKQLFIWCWWSTIDQWLRNQIDVEFFRNSLRILSTITIPIQWDLDKF